MACYSDNFGKDFKDQNELLDFLLEREACSEWRRIETKSVRLQVLDLGTPSGQNLFKEYQMMGEEDILTDTARMTELLLFLEDVEYPVRSCAVRTILERARISGNALKSVSKDVFTYIVNHCLAVTRGKALVKLADGKVSALHGGDASEYAVLDMYKLLDMVVKFLNDNYPGYHYEYGFFNHDYVTAFWSFPSDTLLIETYEKLLADHGVEHTNLCPALRFCTSDTGISGANLFPMLLLEKRHPVSLSGVIKLNHKGKACLKDFEKHLMQINSKYQYALKKLSDLLEIEIFHPEQTMLRIMKHISVPKKLAYQTTELFITNNGSGACTAHDLYYGMNEAVFLMQCNKESGFKIAQTEEIISRALAVRWQDYDYAGTVNW